MQRAQRAPSAILISLKTAGQIAAGATATSQRRNVLAAQRTVGVVVFILQQRTDWYSNAHSRYFGAADADAA